MPHGIARQAAILARRLRAGEQLVLIGPRGSGKSLLLETIQRQLDDVPCARASHTRSLDDITCAWQRAYPNVATSGVHRRTARVRLWRAADLSAGVLLLDDAGTISTQMKGQLRRMRGHIAGVMLVFDGDTARERSLVRQQRLGCPIVVMKPLASRVQRIVLRENWAAHSLAPLSLSHGRMLVRAARGRPGWLVTCAELAMDGTYLRGSTLNVGLLALDTEIRLRAAGLAI